MLKKIFMAIALMLALLTPANAKNQHSLEQPSLLDEILGTYESNWDMVPQPKNNTRLSGRHSHYHLRQFNRYDHNPPSVAYTHHDSPSLVAFGHQLEASGFRVSEHPAFGGVHHVHHGTAHYAGRAIDVNIGTGMVEANNPLGRQRFDALAARARAAGYTVRWRVAGHYDHIHIEK